MRIRVNYSKYICNDVKAMDNGEINSAQHQYKLKGLKGEFIYQLPPVLLALQPIDLIKLSSIRSIHLYQVNVTLHFYE